MTPASASPASDPVRPPPGPLDARASWLIPALAVLAALWTLPGLARTPGPHSDEAWVLVMAEAVRHGTPAEGMNFYTGALHVRLLAVLGDLLGVSLAAARLLGVACNAAALALFMGVARRLVGTETALWAGALVGTSTAYVFMARNAIEVHMLGPLLTMGAWACLVRPATRDGRPWWWLGGFLMGLVVHNHASAAGVPAGAAVAALVLGRSHAVVRRMLAWAALGAAVALVPRAVDLLRNMESWAWRGGVELASPWWTDIPHLPVFLLDCWSGAFFFERVAGVETAALWLVPVAVTAALAAASRGVNAQAPRATWRGAAWAWFLAVVFTLPITRWLSASYLSIPLWLLPALPAAVARGLLLAGRPWPARAALLALCMVQGGLAVANYHVAFDRTGGAVHAFPVGARLVESSAHVVRVDELYRGLVDRGLQVVVADPFILGQLMAPDLGAARIEPVRWDVMDGIPGDPALPAKHPVLVHYDGANVRSGRAYPAPVDAALDTGLVRWYRWESWAPHFVLYGTTPTPPLP